jgi:hypothetical protein
MPVIQYKLPKIAAVRYRTFFASTVSTAGAERALVALGIALEVEDDDLEKDHGPKV